MTVGAAARHLALLAFLVAAASVCSLGLPQSAAPVSERPSHAAGLPRQIWAVAYNPAAAARVQPSKLARLRARGINVAVAMHLTKRQHTRLRRLNARSRLLVLTPRRPPVCRGPAAAICLVEAASIRSAMRLRGRRGVDLVVVTVSGPAALRALPTRGGRILALVKLKGGRLDARLWTSAIQRAAASPAVDLGVAPVGAAGEKALGAYLEILADVRAGGDALSPPPPPPPPPPRTPPGGCPALLTAPPPGYCTGNVISVTPSNWGRGVFGSGGIALSPGDVVVFEDGTYTESNTDGNVMRITASGTATKWITFVSRTKWGAHMWGNDNDVAEGISLAGADYVRVEGFEVSDVGNVGSPRGSASGIDLYDGGNHSQIVGNHVHHVGRVCANSGNTNGQVGLYVQTGKNAGSIVVENNLVHDIGRFFVGENGCGNTTVSLDHGMYLNGSADGGGGAGNITIRNNIFHDTHHGWGVQMYPGSLSNVHVLNNTFAFCNENKSYTCIVLDASISGSSIKNNIFWNPQGGRTIEAAGFSGSITVAHNFTRGDAMHDQGSNPSGMTLSNNLLNGNPLLVSPPGNFRVQSGSPAINAGETLASVTVDHEGTGRPQSGAYDIGAYER